MDVTVVAEKENYGVTTNLYSRLRANRFKPHNFSLRNILESDAVVLRPDDRSPEICGSIGFLWGLYNDDYRSIYSKTKGGEMKNVPVIALWNKAGDLPSYGFYNTIFSGNVAGTVRRTMSLLRGWSKKKFLSGLPEKNLADRIDGIPEDFVTYIAGDVRNPESQQVLYEMGHLMQRRYGSRPIIPPEAIDAYNPKRDYHENPCAIPEDSFQFVDVGKGLEDGVAECMRNVEEAHLVFARVDKPDNMGPWIEIGYAISKGLPIVGLDRYHWPKRSRKSTMHDEITAYNSHWGLDKIDEDWENADKTGERPLWMCFNAEHVDTCIEMLVK